MRFWFGVLGNGLERPFSVGEGRWRVMAPFQGLGFLLGGCPGAMPQAITFGPLRDICERVRGVGSAVWWYSFSLCDTVMEGRDGSGG